MLRSRVPSCDLVCGLAPYARSTYGQLGNSMWSHAYAPPARVAAPTMEPSASEPFAAAALPRFRAIACGHAHSVALSEAGEVYAWGNPDAGRLGLTLTADRVDRGWWLPAPLAGGGAAVVVPLRVDGVGNVAHISAGWAHTLASTHAGRVYGWGDLSDHCLGLGRTEASTRRRGSDGLLREAPPTLYAAETVSVGRTGDAGRGAGGNSDTSARRSTKI